VIIAAADGKILEANDYYLNMLGFTRREFESGKVDWRTITPTESLPADEKAIRELRERGTCTPYEKEYRRKDGTRVPVFLADTLLPGSEEQIAAFVLDITDRKQAEESLRKSEAQLRAVLDATRFPVALVDVSQNNIEILEPQRSYSFRTYRADCRRMVPDGIPGPRLQARSD